MTKNVTRYLKTGALFLLLVTAVTNLKAQWTELGTSSTSVNNSSIFSITTDANGNLYAGGFSSSGSLKYYATQWNGTSWSIMGSNSSFNQPIYSMTTDAIGNVYAAGNFSNSNSKYYVAKWNGSSWSELGGANTSTFNASIKSITTDLNGNVYAAGVFGNANNKEYVAKWDGSSWSELGGTNTSTFNQTIAAITTDKNGNVYATGAFTNGSGNNYVAEWNGSSWAELGGYTFKSSINCLTTDANGNLYAGGYNNDVNNSYNIVSKWNGSSWSQLGTTGISSNFFPNSGISSITSDKSGNIFASWVFFDFSTFSGSNYVSKWDGNSWSILGTSSTFNSSINSITTDAGGNLYASGAFTDGNSNRYVAKYSAPITYTWVSASSTAWNTANNWSPASVPTSADNVIIPSNASVQPRLSVNTTINNIEIDGSSILFLKGLNLTVNGVLSGTGTIQTSSSSSTLTLANSSNNTIGSLLNPSILTTLTISGPLTVTKRVYNSGPFVTGGNLTLASTCYVDGNQTYSANFSGNVTVQHTIPQGFKAFRCLGVPLSGAGTIASTWGPQLVSGTSVYQYGSSGVTTVATSSNLQPKLGYEVLIDASAGAKTLSATGTLLTGDQTITLNATSGTWNFIANPYQSQVDFSLLTMSGLYQGFYYLDPNAQVNSYLAWSWYSTGTGVSNIYSPSQLNGYIQPGQAFWVCSNAANPSLKFTETAKLNTGTQTAIFGAAAPLNRIATGLFANGKNVDGAVAVFNNNFSKTMGQEDGPKISNQGENITFVVANADVSANGWTLPAATDELPMHLYNLKTNTAYTLQLDASQFVGNGLSAYIKDKVLGTQTLLAGNSNLVAFTTTTDTAAYSNRFSIVFGAGALPVRSIAVTATDLANKQIAIKWTAVGESNVASYKVERSVDGKNFTSLATISPSTSHNYSFVDATIPSGAGVYYRIKATDNTGAVSYSNVAKLTTYDLRLTTLTVSPNPLVTKTFKVGLGNSGKYNLNLVDVLGKTVYTTTLNHTEGTLNNVTLNSKLAAGSYTLKATAENGTIETTQVIIK